MTTTKKTTENSKPSFQDSLQEFAAKNFVDVTKELEEDAKMTALKIVEMPQSNIELGDIESEKEEAALRMAAGQSKRSIMLALHAKGYTVGVISKIVGV